MTLEQQPLIDETETIDKLLSRIDGLNADIRALRIRVVFLEDRLEQRERKTVSQYERVMPYVKGMRDKILKIFLELPSSVGLLHEEIMAEFAYHYPHINTKNLPRRVRELVNEGKLWKNQDPDGKARFYLKLSELEDSEQKEVET